MYQCMIGVAPPAARSAMRRAIASMERSFARLAPPQRARTCRLATNAMKQALIKQPQFSACVKP
jgi:hypothetical protein